MNKVYLYLKKDIELGAIIEKIRVTREKEIVLVIPEETKSLLHHLNFEIFKNEVEKLNKKVFLSTEDEKLKNLALKFNFPLFLDDTEGQQIVDIKPPTSAPAPKNLPEKIDKLPGKKAEIFVPNQQPSKKFVLIIKKIIFYLFSFAFLGILLIVVWQQLQVKAEIIISPEKKDIDFSTLITLNGQIISPDYEKKDIPAEYVKIDLNKVETITTTGKIFTEDQPLLKVSFLSYLNYEESLIQGTRIAYKDNVFKTLERVSLPPKNDQGPGEAVTLAVPFALQDPNFSLAKETPLTIVALEGKRDKNGVLWSDLVRVKVAEDYNLGNVQKIGSVSPEDITNVKSTLTESLNNALRAQLAIKYSNYFYILDPSLINLEVMNISHKVGEKTDKISATGKITAELLMTNKDQLDEFVRTLINKEILAKEEKLVIDRINYTKVNLVDLNKKNKTLTVAVNAKVVLAPDLNPERIKADIKGKSLKEVKDYYLAKIIKTGGSVTIRIFPQWKSSLPNDPGKIKIIFK